MDVNNIEQLVYYSLTCHNKTVGHTFIGVFYGPDIPDRINDNSTMILLSEPPIYHCVSVHVIQNGVSAEYFDPAGQPAHTYGREIGKFVAQFPNLDSNPFPFQDEYSNVCAGYSAMFVVLKSLGRSFESIIDEFLQPIVPDMKMCLELAKQPLLKDRKFKCGVKKENYYYELTTNYPNQGELTKKPLNSEYDWINLLTTSYSQESLFIVLLITTIFLVCWKFTTTISKKLLSGLVMEIALIAYAVRKTTNGFKEFASTFGIEPT